MLLVWIDGLVVGRCHWSQFESELDNGFCDWVVVSQSFWDWEP